jgi:hypothetical protein
MCAYSCFLASFFCFRGGICKLNQDPKSKAFHSECTIQILGEKQTKIVAQTKEIEA